MEQLVVMGASLRCTFGVTSSALVVMPEGRIMINNQPAANINDFIPCLNILPFGGCMAPSNPAVIAAALAGTIAPCVPITTTPWIIGAVTLMIGGAPALTTTSVLMCQWGGIVSVESQEQTTIQV